MHRRLAPRARIVVCGTAAVSSWDPWPAGARVERHILVKRARMEGFLLFDFADRFAEARARLLEWVDAGNAALPRTRPRRASKAPPGAIAMLYAGENTGKLLIRP